MYLPRVEVRFEGEMMYLDSTKKSGISADQSILFVSSSLVVELTAAEQIVAPVSRCQTNRSSATACFVG